MSRVSCQSMSECLRLRVGAIGILINQSRQVGTPSAERSCMECMECRERRVDYGLYACFHERCVKVQLAAIGWTQPIDAAHKSLRHLLGPTGSPSLYTHTTHTPGAEALAIQV